MTTQIYSHPECNDFVRKMRAEGHDPVPFRALGWTGPAVLGVFENTTEAWLKSGYLDMQEFPCAEGVAVCPKAVGRIVPRRISDNLGAVLDDLHELGLIDIPTGISETGGMFIHTKTESCSVDITRTLDVFGWAFQCGMPLLSQAMAQRMRRRARGIWRGVAARAAQERLDELWERVA